MRNTRKKSFPVKEYANINKPDHLSDTLSIIPLSNFQVVVFFMAQGVLPAPEVYRTSDVIYRCDLSAILFTMITSSIQWRNISSKLSTSNLNETKVNSLLLNSKLNQACFFILNFTSENQL